MSADDAQSGPGTWRKPLLLSALSLAIVGEASAGPADCVPIADSAARLACYDRALGRSESPVDARVSAAAEAAPAAASSKIEPAPSPAEQGASVAAAAATAAVPAASVSAAPRQGAAAPVDTFGKESLPAAPRAEREKEPERVLARVVGMIDGPARGQELLLDNGQRWQNIDDRDFSVVESNPQVTLWRNLIGSYWLRIEPRGPQMRVRRVK